MVAGEHPETAGILREHLADAELGREVGDLAGRVAERLVPARLGQVPLQVIGRGGLPGQQHLVGGGLFQHAGGGLVEHPQGVVPGRLPAGGVDRGEQLLHRRVPGPAQVPSQCGERTEWFGNGRKDREAMEWSHSPRLYKRSKHSPRGLRTSSPANFIHQRRISQKVIHSPEISPILAGPLSVVACMV